MCLQQDALSLCHRNVALKELLSTLGAAADVEQIQILVSLWGAKDLKWRDAGTPQDTQAQNLTWGSSDREDEKQISIFLIIGVLHHRCPISSS